jgi:hypothetical protein
VLPPVAVQMATPAMPRTKASLAKPQSFAARETVSFKCAKKHTTPVGGIDFLNQKESSVTAAASKQASKQAAPKKEMNDEFY